MSPAARLMAALLATAGMGLCLTAERGWAARHPGEWRGMEDTAEGKRLRGELKGKGRICFATNRDGNFEIYVMNADGSDQTNLTKNPGWDMFPRWTPDGTKILFYSDRDSKKKLGSFATHNLTMSEDPWKYRTHRRKVKDGLYHFTGIYLMDADGSNVKKISDGGVNACLSPDGKHLAYEEDNQITIKDLVTGKTHKAVPRAWGGAWLPSFSPDGRRLLAATASRWSTPGTRIGYCPTVFELDSQYRPTGEYRVMAFGGDGCHPEWSPDGRKILFCQDTRGATIGWIGIDERGAGKYPFPVPHVVDIGLNRDNHILACPDWSPDGKYVVFSLGPVHFEVKRRVVRFGHKTPWDQKGQRIFQEICVSRFDPSDGKKVWIQLTEGGFANRDPDWGR